MWITVFPEKRSIIGDQMISLSALLLWRRCIICPSSESQGRVAGWSLWRFMAPSLALIASSSPASLGRPRQSCDQCGGPPTGGSDQKAVRWTPLGRQMAPWTDDKQRPRQKQRGDVWLMVWVRTLTWLSQREREQKRRIMRALAALLTIYCRGVL